MLTVEGIQVEDALLYHRLQFAFTISFHYLFPQLTMGLALLIVFMKTLALRHGDEGYHRAARLWIRVFAVNFAMGVVTGIPMEFQFGTNWARFSELTGSVIGQTLALEGMFSFFLESSFIGLMLFGEKLTGSTQPCLDFIQNEQDVVMVADFPHFLKITDGRDDDPSFTLNGFHQKGNGVGGDGPFQGICIPEGDGDESGRKGTESIAV